MGLETGTYVSDLNAAWPLGTDLERQGDDHLRLVKTTLKNSFPNISGPANTQAGRSASANYTMVLADDKAVFFANASAGSLTLTLPLSTSLAPIGSKWSCKVIRVDTNTANTVTIATQGSDLVNGLASIVIAVPGDAWEFLTNAAGSWYAAHGSAQVNVGASPPATPGANALWWDSIGGQLYVWYNDGNSTQWVVANNTQVQAGVASFNARQGAVTLTPNDVRAASVGVTDGSNAAAGQIGEYLTATGGGQGLTTVTPANTASLTLQPGDWEVWGFVGYNMSVAASVLAVAINTSVALGTYYNSLSVNSNIFTSQQLAAMPQRISISAATTIYMIGYASFASGTVTATGTIFARRVR